MTKKKEQPPKTVEDQDFFFYNSEEDKKEVIECLGLDNYRQDKYSDNYQNEFY